MPSSRDVNDAKRLTAIILDAFDHHKDMEMTTVLDRNRRRPPTSDGGAASGGAQEEDEDNQMYMLYWTAESKENVMYKAMGIATTRYCVLIMKPSNTETFAKDLYEELECPVCLQYMVPPITLCASGHNVCSACKSKLRHCSICRAEFTDTRCISLENLVRKTVNSCKHKRYGCDKVMTLEELATHQPQCEHRKHKCPFSILGSCPWRGTEEDIATHVREEHTQPGESRDIEGMYMASCSNMREEGSWNMVLFILGQVFLMYTKTKDNMLFVMVLYVGDRHKARNYKYECIFETSDRTKTMTSSEVTESYYRDIADVIAAEECAVVRYSFVKKCIRGDGSFCFKMTVSEA